jgi:hypothetical protein
MMSLRHWRFLWSPWQRAGADLLAAMDAVLGGARRPWLALTGLLVSSVAAWFVYVPVHELLHALGCVATGGEVTELQISPLYGGRVLESLIPAVVAGGSYAGRLSGFETHGSDLVYLATDAAPFLLTILLAVPLLRWARRTGRPLLFGFGAVMISAALISLTGDYYEMGSILTSATLLQLGAGGEIGSVTEAQVLALRSDDLFALAVEFGELFPERQAVWALAVLVSFLTGVALATLTMAAALKWGDWTVGPPTK